jgi:hypothetical protein
MKEEFQNIKLFQKASPSGSLPAGKGRVCPKDSFGGGAA